MGKHAGDAAACWFSCGYRQTPSEQEQRLKHAPASAVARHASSLTRPSASSPAALLPQAMTTQGTKLIRLLAFKSMPAAGAGRGR